MAEVTYLEALRQGLWEEMERDDRVFILGEDVGIYGGAFKVTEGFVKRFGEARVIDTPISEAAIVGAAAGAAHMGMRPARAFPRRWWCGGRAAATCAVGRSIPRTWRPPSFTRRA